MTDLLRGESPDFGETSASSPPAGGAVAPLGRAGRGHRRREVGVVVSDKGQKTITVLIRRLVKHRKYGKYVLRSTRCRAHDEENEAREGDRVEIMETKPISKTKRWRLVSVVERAPD